MEHDLIDIRSDKVKRLLAEKPSPLVRYGTLVLLIIFAITGAVIGCYFW